MSNIDEIKDRVAQGRLFEIKQRDLRADNSREYRRWIYVSPELYREIFNRRDETAFRMLSAQFQNFILGKTIPVALVSDHKDAQWARLGPAGHEVWESRVRDKRHYLTVLGRFYELDTFIGFNLYDSPLKGKSQWDGEKVRCQADWAVLFPATPPVYGVTIHDYIGTNVTLI
jgi:hypothetical protein